MLRRTTSVALLAALAAAGVYWWLSAPVVAAAGTAPARAPDLANGQVMFNAGGCASCHAVPDQPDRLRLGAASRSSRRSERSTRRTSPPIRPTASANGARPNSSTR